MSSRPLLERKTGGHSKRSRPSLLWPMRFVVFGGAFVLVWRVIYVQLSGGLGLLLGALLAASAIVLEIWLTSKLGRRSLRDVVTWRLLFIDRLLSRPGEAIVDQPQSQVRGSEEKGRLERGRDA